MEPLWRSSSALISVRFGWAEREDRPGLQRDLSPMAIPQLVIYFEAHPRPPGRCPGPFGLEWALLAPAPHNMQLAPRRERLGKNLTARCDRHKIRPSALFEVQRRLRFSGHGGPKVRRPRLKVKRLAGKASENRRGLRLHSQPPAPIRLIVCRCLHGQDLNLQPADLESAALPIELP